jgi:hypothetical protein
MTIAITEYMYKGQGGEFVEFTNVGDTPVNMANWSFDDEKRMPGKINLSAFGIVNPRESVILTEGNANNFRNDWDLTSNIKVIGGNKTNLSRNDEINLYDSFRTLVDRLTYGDEEKPGSIVTDGRSGWVPRESLFLNDIFKWRLSTVGDDQNSYRSIPGDIGNPGSYISPPTLITVDFNATTDFLDGGGTALNAVSGVIDDPTDPARTLGIWFNADSSVNLANVQLSSSNQSVVPDGNLDKQISGSQLNLKITPQGVGYTDIIVEVSNNSTTDQYIIQYAASDASVTPETTRFHTGSSDASTVIELDSDYMLVADDEDEVIRLYDRDESGLPLTRFDLRGSLNVTGDKEVDIEASTSVGNRIYWIGSHSNDKDNGKDRPNRKRIFSTDLNGVGVNTTLNFVGRYEFLEDDLVAWDVNNGHGLGANYFGLQASAAYGTLPEANDGFNIEGLVMAPGSSTTAYVAFRAPLTDTVTRDQALIVPVENFTTIVDTTAGSGSTDFGAPIQLDLGGRGIRSIDRNSKGQYLIVAGPTGSDTSPDAFRLYTWIGEATDAPEPLNPSLAGLRPEAAILPDDLNDFNSQIQLLSDNGEVDWYGDGQLSKDLPLDNFQKFRSDVVALYEEPIFGTPEDDELNIFDGSVIVLAGDGDDLVDASQSSGNNQLFGGAGNDELFASSNDRLFGEAGKDILNAAVGTGNNRLYGGDGNDILFAGVSDRLFGGNGDSIKSFKTAGLSLRRCVWAYTATVGFI